MVGGMDAGMSGMVAVPLMLAQMKGKHQKQQQNERKNFSLIDWSEWSDHISDNS